MVINEQQVSSNSSSILKLRHYGIIRISYHYIYIRNKSIQLTTCQDMSTYRLDGSLSRGRYRLGEPLSLVSYVFAVLELLYSFHKESYVRKGTHQDDNRYSIDEQRLQGVIVDDHLWPSISFITIVYNKYLPIRIRCSTDLDKAVTIWDSNTSAYDNDISIHVTVHVRNLR